MIVDRRIPVRATIAILCIGASTLAIVLFYRTRASNAPVPVTVVAVDIDTAKLVEVVKKPDDKWPLEDPETGLNTLYEGYICRDQKIIFPVRGVATRCPSCGSVNVGGIAHNEDYKDYPVTMEYFRP